MALDLSQKSTRRSPQLSRSAPTSQAVSFSGSQAAAMQAGPIPLVTKKRVCFSLHDTTTLSPSHVSSRPHPYSPPPISPRGSRGTPPVSPRIKGHSTAFWGSPRTSRRPFPNSTNNGSIANINSNNNNNTHTSPSGRVVVLQGQIPMDSCSDDETRPPSTASSVESLGGSSSGGSFVLGTSGGSGGRVVVSEGVTLGGGRSLTPPGSGRSSVVSLMDAEDVNFVNTNGVNNVGSSSDEGHRPDSNHMTLHPAAMTGHMTMPSVPRDDHIINKLPSDPRDWSREDVAVWLHYMKSVHHLTELQPERFLMNGKALCLMNTNMFSYRVPLGGKLLYRDFRTRLALAVARQAAMTSVTTSSTTSVHSVTSSVAATVVAQAARA